MKSLRNLVIAGTIAAAGALSAGTANASPVADLALPIATDNVVTQAYYPGGYYPGYGFRRYCYIPFYRLVQYFGYWRARMIKQRCHYTPYYGYNGYNGYNNYGSY